MSEYDEKKQNPEDSALPEEGNPDGPGAQSIPLKDVVPEEPDGYMLPEAWTAETVAEEIAARVSEILAGDRGEFMRVCHACSLTGRQAAALFDAVGGVMAQSLAEADAARRGDSPHGQQNTHDLEEGLRALWPRDTRRHAEIVRRGAVQAGVDADLRESGLAGHPTVLRILHALGSGTGEDVVRGGARAAASLPTGEAARREMYRVIRSDGYRTNDPGVMRMLEALAARVGAR